MIDPAMMQPITSAARIVHMKQRCHRDGIELLDLVQSAVEKVLIYLGPLPSEKPVLVFVCAKQGAEEYVRHWRGITQRRSQFAGRSRSFSRRPKMLPYDELESLPHIWQRSTPRPPIELMIDLLRELLALRLTDAYAWVTCRLHDDPYDVAARELGYSRESIKNMVARGQTALRDRLGDYSGPAWSSEKTAAKLLAEGMGLHKVARRVGRSPDTLRPLQDRLDATAKARRDGYVAISRRHIDVAEIFRLRKTGLTHEAIAEQLCCSPATVGKYLHRRQRQGGV